MKRVFVFIPIIVLLLVGCSSQSDPNCGVYTCEQLINDGEKIKVDSVFSAPPVLELLPEGKLALTVNDGTYKGKWSVVDGSFSAEIGGVSFYGSLHDGICSFEPFEYGLTFCFYSQNAPLPNWSGLSEYSDRNNTWSGSWYGFAYISDAYGNWKSLDGQYIDCFAYIDMLQDNTGSIIIWDENGSLNKPTAKVELELSGTGRGFGTAASRSGFFFLQDIGEGDWHISPDKEQLRSLLRISDRYSSTEGGFKYEIILRPWGYVWDDAAESGLAQLPFYYDCWYIPMLAEGESMPEKADFSRVENIPFELNDEVGS